MIKVGFSQFVFAVRAMKDGPSFVTWKTTMSELVISGANLSEVWARAFLRVARARDREARPLVVTVSTALGRVLEREDIRRRLDGALSDCGEYAVGTVASTIFPQSL